MIPTPNPQAVEAVMPVLEASHRAETEAPTAQDDARLIVQAAEPHICSQVLTELAEELLSEKSVQRGWDRWNECKDKGVGIQPFLLKRAIEPMLEAACRELAAKEEGESE